MNTDYRKYRQINKVAQTPPLGWNSWDVFGCDVTEDEVRAMADYMAAHLRPAGYEYVVVDIAWYAPGSTAVDEQYKRPNPHQVIDEYGRVIPDPARFPSSAGGKGFAPLAQYVHSKGLKFGAHIMRGIPIQAVRQNTPIKGTPHHAQDIMKFEERCSFYDGMYAVDMTCPGAVEYYQSLLDLLASWGVDFVKADDMISWPQHFEEVKAFRWAMDHCGRPMTLSLSPGAAGYMERSLLTQYSDMFRVTGDLWDNWPAVRGSFDAARWAKGHTGPGNWADLDMIPLGVINIRAEGGGGARATRLTRDEQRTLMTLWTIFRSPLMLGMDLRQLDDWTLSLVANADAIRIDQTSVGNDEVFRDAQTSVWSARSPDGRETYVALFNLADEPRTLSADFALLGLSGPQTSKDVWSGEVTGGLTGRIEAAVPAHGCAYYILTAQASHTE